MKNVITEVLGQPLAVRKGRAFSLSRSTPAVNKIIRNIALTLFFSNTIGILMCIDLLVFGRLNMTLFLGIIVSMLFLYLGYFRHKHS